MSTIKVRHSEPMTGWAMIMLISVFFAFIKWIALGLFLGIFIWATYKLYKVQKRRIGLRRVEHDLMVQRAYWENYMALQGDPVGVYGQYDPYTMPMTDEKPDWSFVKSEPREWYDYE